MSWSGGHDLDSKLSGEIFTGGRRGLRRHRWRWWTPTSAGASGSGRPSRWRAGWTSATRATRRSPPRPPGWGGSPPGGPPGRRRWRPSASSRRRRRRLSGPDRKAPLSPRPGRGGGAGTAARHPRPGGWTRIGSSRPGRPSLPRHRQLVEGRVWALCHPRPAACWPPSWQPTPPTFRTPPTPRAAARLGPTRRRRRNSAAVAAQYRLQALFDQRPQAAGRLGRLGRTAPPRPRCRAALRRAAGRRARRAPRVRAGARSTGGSSRGAAPQCPQATDRRAAPLAPRYAAGRHRAP